MERPKVFRKKSCKRFAKFVVSFPFHQIEVLGEPNGRKSGDLECVARVL